jgi:hypothetical protein
MDIIYFNLLNAKKNLRVGLCQALGGLCGRKWSKVAANVSGTFKIIFFY